MLWYSPAARRSKFVVFQDAPHAFHADYRPTYRKAAAEEGWALAREELGQLPRAVNFISGPSRTGDIEQTIVLGAHGPYRVHLVLVRGA